MVLETADPVIQWLSIILEFATSIKNTSCVIGTEQYIGPTKEVVVGPKRQSSNQVKVRVKEFKINQRSSKAS